MSTTRPAVFCLIAFFLLIPVAPSHAITASPVSDTAVYFVDPSSYYGNYSYLEASGTILPQSFEDVTVEAYVYFPWGSPSRGKVPFYILSKDGFSHLSVTYFPQETNGNTTTKKHYKFEFDIFTHSEAGKHNYKLVGYRLLDYEAWGKWIHIAGTYQKSTNELKLFIDGVWSQSYSGTSWSLENLDERIVIGELNTFSLDELRISQTNRYPSSFTRPSTPFAVDAQTLALWHFDEPNGGIIPNAPTGVKELKVNTPATYTTAVPSSGEGHSLEYQFDWGDGLLSPWSAAISADHVWSEGKTYTVRARTRCATHLDELAYVSSSLSVLVLGPPTVSAVSPFLGSTAGGTAITLTGKDFGTTQGSGTVTGDALPLSITSWSNTKITGVTAAHSAGPADIRLTRYDGETTTVVAGYHYAEIVRHEIKSSDIPKGIIDNQTITSLITAPKLTITDVNVKLSLSHLDDSHLDMYLLSPDGTTRVELSTDNGYSGDNYIDTIFDDEGTATIASGAAPFSGSFKPEQALTVFDGKEAFGSWTLEIVDDTTGTTGTLNEWSLIIEGAEIALTPQITTISPTAGGIAGGEKLTITGANFGATQGSGIVTFGNVVAVINSWTANRIECLTPAHPAGLVEVAVTTGDGQRAAKVDAFRFLVDADGDGSLDDIDCDDVDPTEHPGQTWYKDNDNDGYSDGTINNSSCNRPAGYKTANELTTTTGDCDDSASDKIIAGTCGCGVADTDTDKDGTPDCNDTCPSDPNKIKPGICGCGVADSDTDKDGTPDCNDTCASDPNKTKPGTCGCGVADTDTDMDGTPDCKDSYPFEPLAMNRIIAGQVMDINGQGLAGIKVEALSPAIDRSYATTSDEDGLYRIDVAMAPDYLVSAGGQGCRRHFFDDAHTWAEAERVNVMTGDRLGVDFVLETGSSLRGVLHGLEAGRQAVIEAWSELTQGWGTIAATGTGGAVTFTIEGLPPAADYVLYIHAEGSLTGYLTADGRIDSWKPEPCHEAGGDDPIEIQLPTGHAITGTISGLTSGTSALVSAWDQAGVVHGATVAIAAAEPSAYTITGLADGIYLVAIEIDGYADGYWAGTLAGVPAAPGMIDAATPIVVSGQDGVGINFSVTAGHTLRGTVVGLGQGEEVTLSAWSDTTGAWQDTGVLGAGGGSDPFTLTGLNGVDDYFLYVDSAKYRCGYLGGGQITSGENADRFNAADDPAGILINLTTGKSISGLVRGLDLGEAAVLEAWSDKTGSWGSTVLLGTGAELVYTITNLAPARDFVVTFAPDWHLGSVRPSVDTTDNASGIDFTASRAVSISGTIINAEADATVVVAAWSAATGAYHQEMVFTNTTGNATFALTGLAPAGDYLVMAIAGTEIVYYGEATGPGNRTPVDVSQGNATGITLDFSVLTSHTLTAIIAGVTGKIPVRLEAWTSDGVQRAAERAGNGRIQLDLPAGQYKISVSADGYVPAYYAGSGAWKNDLGAATLADLQTGDPNLGTITLTRGFTVAGTVCLDSNNDGLCGTSEGMASTLVEIGGNNLTFQASATTDSRGRYRIEGLPNGNYTLRVWTIEGKATKDITVNGQDQSGIHLLMGGTGTGAAAGTVTLNGTLAPDAFVGLFDEHGFVNAQLTDNQGTFRFDGLPAGPGYYLKVDVDFDGIVDYPAGTGATVPFAVPAPALEIPVVR